MQCLEVSHQVYNAYYEDFCETIYVLVNQVLAIYYYHFHRPKDYLQVFSVLKTTAF